MEDGHELTTDVYVPLVQLTADVPGHWSDNGMALEPGQSCVVKFIPEGSVAQTDVNVVVNCTVNTPQ